MFLDLFYFSIDPSGKSRHSPSQQFDLYSDFRVCLHLSMNINIYDLFICCLLIIIYSLSCRTKGIYNTRSGRYPAAATSWLAGTGRLLCGFLPLNARC